MNRCPRPKHVCGSFHRTGWSRRVLEPLALGVPLSSRHCCCSSCPSQRNSAVVVAFSCALRARSAPCIALLRHINSSFRVWISCCCCCCWCTFRSGIASSLRQEEASQRSLLWFARHGVVTWFSSTDREGVPFEVRERIRELSDDGRCMAFHFCASFCAKKKQISDCPEK